MTVHMLFAPTGCLKIKTAAYHRIHADLVRSYQAAKSAHTKRQRAEIRSRRFKQTGDTHG